MQHVNPFLMIGGIGAMLYIFSLIEKDERRSVDGLGRPIAFDPPPQTPLSPAALRAVSSSPDPATYALMQLRRAYAKGDYWDIDRWQNVADTTRARNYLNAVKARDRRYAAEGFPGFSGLG